MLRLLPIQKTQKHQCQIDLHPQPGKTVIGVRKYIEQNIEEVFYDLLSSFSALTVFFVGYNP